ncbi:hypothetical protein T10_11290 [Trichinella papuae]|uniref:Uncharacterized protein n=1 Tax=Trichinella papuae TaxID=268474 RepID=A0A0V1MW59_9BILA|nr:hypothetical protein T10_11290 [Trichinella papuae]
MIVIVVASSTFQCKLMMMKTFKLFKCCLALILNFNTSTFRFGHLANATATTKVTFLKSTKKRKCKINNLNKRKRLFNCIAAAVVDVKHPFHMGKAAAYKHTYYSLLSNLAFICKHLQRCDQFLIRKYFAKFDIAALVQAVCCLLVQCSVANCRQNAMNGFIVLSIVRVVYFRSHHQQRRQAAFALCFALDGLGLPAFNVKKTEPSTLFKHIFLFNGVSLLTINIACCWCVSIIFTLLVRKQTNKQSTRLREPHFLLQLLIGDHFFQIIICFFIAHRAFFDEYLFQGFDYLSRHGISIAAYLKVCKWSVLVDVEDVERRFFPSDLWKKHRCRQPKNNTFEQIFLTSRYRRKLRKAATPVPGPISIVGRSSDGNTKDPCLMVTDSR